MLPLPRIPNVKTSSGKKRPNSKARSHHFPSSTPFPIMQTVKSNKQWSSSTEGRRLLLDHARGSGHGQRRRGVLVTGLGAVRRVVEGVGERGSLLKPISKVAICACADRDS